MFSERSWSLTRVVAGRTTTSFNSLTPMSVKRQNSREIPNFILENIEKQMAPCKRTAEEVSFEWSHHRIPSTDSKVRTILNVSIIYSGGERVKF